MTEILFRGTDVNNNKVYTSMTVMPTESGNYALLLGSGRWVEVFADSLGQYTGVKDCHDLPIFSGDKVNTPDGVGYVTFDYGTYCIYIDEKHFPAIDFYSEDQMEVIF